MAAKMTAQKLMGLIAASLRREGGGSVPEQVAWLSVSEVKRQARGLLGSAASGALLATTSVGVG